MLEFATLIDAFHWGVLCVLMALIFIVSEADENHICRLSHHQSTDTKI